MPNDATEGSQVNIWISALGVISVIFTVFVGPVAIEWVKGKIAQRTGRPVAGEAKGLNSPIDVNAPGITGYGLESMLGQMQEVLRRLAVAEGKLDSANDEIRQLKQNEAYHDYRYQQALTWGSTAEGIPPRTVPDFLKSFNQGPV